MYNKNMDSLLKAKRILAFTFSLGLIAVSVWFSQQGFGIESSKDVMWLGWFLGGTVTVIQLVFNTSIKNLNPTLIAAGIVAYLYGVYTNVTGLHEYLNGWGFSIIVGLIIEVLPEPLFAWAIGVTDGGDVVGNIGELFGGTPTQPKPQYSSQKPSNNPVHVMRFRQPDTKSVPNQFKNKKKSKLVSPIFNDNYVKRFKK